MNGTASDSSDDRHDRLAKLARLAAGIKVCMFATIDADGRPLSRPMAMQGVEFDGDLWFFTKRGGRKLEHIRGNPAVNVSFSSRSSWVSISGSAEVVDDDARVKELWNAGIEAWLPDGPDDPDVVLVRVRADGAEYWDTPGAAIASVLSFVKAKLTSKPHHIEDERLDL